MIILGEYSGENVVYFKSFNFDFDYKGVSHIRGLNRNSKIQGRNNGAGKSLFASGLSELICDTQPVITKEDARSVSDMFVDGTLLNLDVNGSTIVKSMRKGKIGYTIVDADQGDLGKLTNTKAQQVIDGLFPLSETSFYTYFHLDSRRPFPIQTQNSTVRIDTFCDIFGLDNFDLMKEYIDSKLSSIKGAIVKFETLKKTRDALGELEDVDDLATKLNNTQQRLETCRAQIETLRSKVQDPKAEKRKAKARTLLEYFSLSADAEGAERFTAGYHKFRARLVAGQSDARSYAQYQKARKKFDHLDLDRVVEETVKGLKDQIEEQREELEKVDATVAMLTHSVKSQESTRLLYESMVAARKTVIKALDLDKRLDFSGVYIAVSEGRATAVARKSQLAKAIDKLRTSEGECLSCGTPITKEHKKRHMSALAEEKTEVDELVAFLSGLESEIETLSRWPNVSTYDPDVDLTADKEKAEAKRKRIRATIKDLEEKLEVRRAQDTLAEYGTPTAPKRTESESEEALDYASALYAMLPDVVWSSSGSTEDSEKFTALVEREQELSSAVQRLRSRIEVARHKWEEANRLDFELSGARDEVSAAPAYKLLQQAYGPKGIKSLAVGRVARRIEHCINQMSSSCLPEPIEFEFDVGIDKFNIIAHRASGKVSDVRRLSGSESLCFNMMMAGAIIQNLPSTQRCNSIILDEMVSHVDPVSVPLIYNNFIPMLNSIVPHVVLLDIGNEGIPGAREYVVVKKGDESRLLEV